jgi:Variant SH3 domain
MKRTRVVRDYRTQYANPIRFAAGEIVTVAHRDTEWPAFIWTITSDGNAGWAPLDWLKPLGDGHAEALRDYSAQELDVDTGDEVVLHSELGGWWWCQRQNGRCGWVPADRLDGPQGHAPGVPKMQWLGIALLSMIATLHVVQVSAQDRPVRFESIQVRPDEAPKTSTFTFSSAAATSASPVVISIGHRKLSASDRKFRTWLQKYWLSANVPEYMTFVSRSLVSCEYKRKNEYAFCDAYVFENPASGQKQSFFIYVGNWP